MSLCRVCGRLINGKGKANGRMGNVAVDVD